MTTAWGTPLLPSTLVERLGWTLLHSLWQLAAVALGLTIVLAMLRRRTPQARYAAGCAALAAMFALPVITFSLAGHWTSSAQNLPRNISGSASSNTSNGQLSAGGSQGGDPSADFTYARWMRRAVNAWGLGVTGFSLWNFGGWIALRRMRNLCNSPVSDDVLARFQSLADKLCVRTPVMLLRSTLVASPVALGWLRPLVLLPASAMTGLTPAQLDAILAHELAHIRRHDYLVNLLQTIAETLLFYHPAVWWVSRRLRIERELCCDDVAATLTDGGRVNYADALVAMEALRGPAPGFEVGPPVLAVGLCDGGLVSRIRRLVGAPPTPGSWRRVVVLLSSAILLPIALAAAIGLPGGRGARVEFADADSASAADEAERERQLVPFHLPRLREVAAMAMSLCNFDSGGGTSQPADMQHESNSSPPSSGLRGMTHTLASAAYRSGRLINVTSVAAGSRRLAAVIYRDVTGLLDSVG